MKDRLYMALERYCRKDILPMHMPGHKRNKKFQMGNPYELDVTEVTGMDDLHHPTGIIKELMDQISAMYHSEHSYLLINGSTGGILAAIAACCRHGDRIVVARNCHRSVYHAIRLLELRPVYVYPEPAGSAGERLGIAGEIRAEAVEQVLRQYDDISCVVITSPTYEGIVSPIRDIAEVVHRKQLPLIVDEAHGAHFNWHNAFPDTALTEGADIVIESLHKTLPAFTQTGLLHVREGFVRLRRLMWSLDTFQSSSPSYLFMAGIDRCFAYIEEEGAEAFDAYVKNLRDFREEMRGLKNLYLFETSAKELSKIVVATDRAGISGKKLADILCEKYRIETEMSCGNYCIAMTSVCDERASFRRFADALKEIDDTVLEIAEKNDGSLWYDWSAPEICMYSFEAADCETESLPVGESAGRIAGEDIYLYPPGIPVVVQGERISEETAAVLYAGEKKGYRIYGVRDGMVTVIAEA
ncbi:MAG: aminotransferase class I/II-fold pyridoxal phosphate-dependent enzyme [Roseburia sp.]|nr:aminotransferase class I/II-fold pyridoxal phosphate-dependent enzyme [Roseburia sp.]